MARPIVFRPKKEFKLVNRCIMCGKIIPIRYAICSSCNQKRQIALKKYIRSRR
jgi:rRNA maturation endonuclease Nob1